MTQEIPLEERFSFGRNWSDFLARLTPERIREAEQSLTDHLGDLSGKRFLDIGCGSGLFSLAAANLGAVVHSLDFDPDSVACARKLHEIHHPDNERWTIEQGSALDAAYMEQLGTFDVVYSWGVLHHTGEMWRAMDNATRRVAEDGLLFIAIYNDQGGWSDVWKAIKKAYVRGPGVVRFLLLMGVLLFMEGRWLAIQLVRFRNPVRMYRIRKRGRGMSAWTDLKDWVGGYPFEVAKPEEVFDFCRERGFALLRLSTNGGGLACNEYVLRLPPRD